MNLGATSLLGDNMGKCFGSVLPNGGGIVMNVGDYLTSIGGMYHMVLLPSSKIGVGYGGAPGDPGGGYLWLGGDIKAESNNYICSLAGGIFAVQISPGGEIQWLIAPMPPLPINSKGLMTVQDDGQLIIFDDTLQNVLWTSGTSGPVVSITNVSALTYDLTNAVVETGAPLSIYQQTVRNDSNVQQTATIRGTKSVEETQSWENSATAGISVSTTFKTGIPIVAEGKVEVSLNASYTYAWGGSKTDGAEWSFDAPMTLDPHTAGKVVVAVSLSKISVPYSAVADVTFKGGTTIKRAQIRSIYEGTNSHNLEVTYFPTGSSMGQSIGVSAKRTVED